MIVKTSNSIQTTQAPADYFTGNAWIDRLVKNENIKCNVAKVTFEPKARNHWHTQPGRTSINCNRRQRVCSEKRRINKIAFTGRCCNNCWQ